MVLNKILKTNPKPNHITLSSQSHDHPASLCLKKPMQRRTKNTNKIYIYIYISEPRIPAVANHVAVLLPLWPSIELRWVGGWANLMVMHWTNLMGWRQVKEEREKNKKERVSFYGRFRLARGREEKQKGRVWRTREHTKKKKHYLIKGANKISLFYYSFELCAQQLLAVHCL